MNGRRRGTDDRVARLVCASGILLPSPVALFYVNPLGQRMASSARTTDIAEHVAKDTGLSNKQARQAVNSTFEAVAKLSDGYPDPTAKG